jgi:hypothetical protein
MTRRFLHNAPWLSSVSRCLGPTQRRDPVSSSIGGQPHQLIAHRRPITASSNNRASASTRPPLHGAPLGSKPGEGASSSIAVMTTGSAKTDSRLIPGILITPVDYPRAGLFLCSSGCGSIAAASATAAAAAAHGVFRFDKPADRRSVFGGRAVMQRTSPEWPCPLTLTVSFPDAQDWLRPNLDWLTRAIRRNCRCGA